MEDVFTIVVFPLDEAGLKLNGEKSYFLPKKLEILGHWIESRLIKPDHGKLNWIQLDCKTVTRVKILIGTLSYFRKFIPKFSNIIRPILDLWTAPDITWIEQHATIAEEVMRTLEAECFLKLSSYDRLFHVATDYSGIGIGGILLQ